MTRPYVTERENKYVKTVQLYLTHLEMNECMSLKRSFGG
jgi:hypothetical protein